eukprot:g354.t1
MLDAGQNAASTSLLNKLLLLSARAKHVIPLFCGKDPVVLDALVRCIARTSISLVAPPPAADCGARSDWAWPRRSERGEWPAAARARAPCAGGAWFTGSADGTSAGATNTSRLVVRVALSIVRNIALTSAQQDDERQAGAGLSRSAAAGAAAARFWPGCGGDVDEPLGHAGVADASQPASLDPRRTLAAHSPLLLQLLRLLHAQDTTLVRDAADVLAAISPFLRLHASVQRAAAANTNTANANANAANAAGAAAGVGTPGVAVEAGEGIGVAAPCTRLEAPALTAAAAHSLTPRLCQLLEPLFVPSAGADAVILQMISGRAARGTGRTARSAEGQGARARDERGAPGQMASQRTGAQHGESAAAGCPGRDATAWAEAAASAEEEGHGGAAWRWHNAQAVEEQEAARHASRREIAARVLEMISALGAAQNNMLYLVGVGGDSDGVGPGPGAETVAVAGVKRKRDDGTANAADGVRSSANPPGLAPPQHACSAAGGRLCELLVRCLAVPRLGPAAGARLLAARCGSGGAGGGEAEADAAPVAMAVDSTLHDMALHALYVLSGQGTAARVAIGEAPYAVERITAALDVRADAGRAVSALRAIVPRVAAGTLANLCLCPTNMAFFHRPHVERALVLATTSTREASVAKIMGTVMWWLERTRALHLHQDGGAILA